MSEYSEKFKDPRWQKKRLEILERDNWTCQICGDIKSTLNVHHKIYFSNQSPWEYGNSLLATLCDNCHKEEHEITKEYLELLLAELYGKGLFGGDLLDFAFSISRMDQEKLLKIASVSDARITRTPKDVMVTPT